MLRLNMLLDWNLASCIGELTSALPFTGGTATFATAAFGSAVGMFTGLVSIILFQHLFAYIPDRNMLRDILHTSGVYHRIYT